MRIEKTTGAVHTRFVKDAFRELLLERYGKEQGKKDYGTFCTVEKSHCFIARKGKKIAGAIKLAMQPGVAKIGAFAVSKDCRGEGAGSELLKKCEDMARKRGCVKIWLWAMPGLPSFEFYKKRGYKVEGRLKKQWGGKRDLCIMSKFL